MRVETNSDEIKLTVSTRILDLKEIQSLIDYIKFRKINSNSKATKKQAEDLANEINQDW